MAEGGEKGPGCWQGAGESACLSLRGRRQWREGDAGQLRRKQGGGEGQANLSSSSSSSACGYSPHPQYALGPALNLRGWKQTLL